MRRSSPTSNFLSINRPNSSLPNATAPSATFYPYYNRHEAVAQQQVRNFAADRAAGHFAGRPRRYITYAMRTLQGVYAAGVISSESMSRLTASGTCGVRVVNGTNA